ncbi:MAG TPA: VWA domain-containing protein, partial [Polyangia bacterium]|nr:VWA domain-containing protein [Polyangia bacterium]
MPSRVRRFEPLLWSVGLIGALTVWYLPGWLTPGSSLRFESPWLLLVLLGAPLVIAAGMTEPRTGGRLRHPLAAMLAAGVRGWRARLLPASIGLRAAAVVLLALALARPQDSSLHQETSLEGVDLMLVLDLSMSMKAGDLEPTRLEAAKTVIRDFIKRRSNDRIGAVVFAENAYTLCPLTLDYSILSTMIAELELGVIDGRATAIGNALGVAINRLRKSDAKSKTIILLTDGASNSGNISPEQATTFARTLGIKIYTVLVGRQDEAQVATGFDFFNMQIFGSQPAPVNPELLRGMSDDTG